MTKTTLKVPCNANRTVRDVTVDHATLIRLATHGAKQKGNDAYVDNKKYPTVEAKVTCFDTIMAMLEHGEWGRERNADPVGNLAWDLFLARLRAATGLRGKELDVKAESLWDKNESAFMALAEKEIAARKAKLDGITIDMAV